MIVLLNTTANVIHSLIIHYQKRSWSKVNKISKLYL